MYAAIHILLVLPLVVLCAIHQSVCCHTYYEYFLYSICPDIPKRGILHSVCYLLVQHTTCIIVYNTTHYYVVEYSTNTRSHLHVLCTLVVSVYVVMRYTSNAVLRSTGIQSACSTCDVYAYV